MTPTIRYLDDPQGLSVAYAVFGSGPLLICPCWWVSHVEKDWDSPEFSRFFTTLGQHFRVVVYDRPGVGLSDRDAPARTLDSEVGLLEAMMDATSDGETATLLAFSCGAPIALKFASENPGRVTRICCYGGFLDGRDIATTDVQRLMLDLIRTHWGMGSRALADVFIPDESREAFDQLVRVQRYSATAEKAAELLALTYSMDATEAVHTLTTEMLVIHRVSDRAIPSAAGRRLAAAVPGTPFLPLRGSAHPPWFGDTDVLDNVIAFLSDRPLDRPIDRPMDRSLDRRAAAAKPGSATGECYLDARNRQLVSPTGTTPLTPLEYGVAQYLIDAADQVVTRDELLTHVWQSPIAGSNKVDAVIRTLRRKFGPYAAAIETVRGHGFRYRPR